MRTKLPLPFCCGLTSRSLTSYTSRRVRFIDHPEKAANAGGAKCGECGVNTGMPKETNRNARVAHYCDAVTCLTRGIRIFFKGTAHEPEP